MWFQAAEWNAVNASLLVKFNKQQLSDFFTKNLPILNAYLPQKSENLQPILVTLLKMRPHYTHSSRENATPSSDTSLLGSCKGVPPPGLSTNLVKFQDAQGKWIVADAGKAAYKLLWTKWWGNRKGRSLEGYDNKLLSFFFRWSLRQSIWHEL